MRKLNNTGAQGYSYQCTWPITLLQIKYLFWLSGVKPNGTTLLSEDMQMYGSLYDTLQHWEWYDKTFCKQTGVNSYNHAILPTIRFEDTKRARSETWSLSYHDQPCWSLLHILSRELNYLKTNQEWWISELEQLRNVNRKLFNKVKKETSHKAGKDMNGC